MTPPRMPSGAARAVSARRIPCHESAVALSRHAMSVTSSVGQFGDPARTAATVTLAAEHSFVRDESVTQSAFAPIAPMREGNNDRHELLETRTNAGIIGQVNASFHETLFMTGGVRVERNTGLTVWCFCNSFIWYRHSQAAHGIRKRHSPAADIESLRHSHGIDRIPLPGRTIGN